MTAVPELEVVGVRVKPVAGHSHVQAVQLADGRVQAASELIEAIEAHDAHYVMRPPEGTPMYEKHKETGLPLLVQVRQCPDCDKKVIFA